MMLVPQEFISSEVEFRRRRGASYVAGAALRSYERVPRKERGRLPHLAFHLHGHRHASTQ